MEAKRLAAEKAVDYIQEGMIVGLGSGTTAYLAIQKIGDRVKEGLNIRAVATSIASEEIARERNIPIIPFSEVTKIDLTIDGADEVDKDRNLIKGGGGALLREKIIASHSKQFIVIVDESKLVDELGQFPLPVEVIPFGVELTIHDIQLLSWNVRIREVDGKPFETDNGNYIVDGDFFPVRDVRGLDERLKRIPGVVETGLFLNTMVSKVIVGYSSGEIREM